MWEAVALPFRSTTNLSLPTTEQIRACTNVLSERYSLKVVQYSKDIVVKFGGALDPAEGQTLIYLERHASEVPAPRLYAMYYEDDELFLVMQRAAGSPLDKLWPSLSELEKQTIVAKLKTIAATMRKVECPWPNFYGGVDGGALRHHLFFSLAGDMEFLGPFDGEAALVTGLTNNYRALMQRNDRSDLKVRFYEQNLATVLRGHRAVLTHGDFQKMNIMVEPKAGNSPDEVTRDFAITLIDWEDAGWYPEFWEFFTASSMFDIASWEDDWCQYAQEIMPVMLGELAVMRMLDKDMGI